MVADSCYIRRRFAPPDLISTRRCAMYRRRLSLLFGLFFAASILTPQGGAQDGIRFEMPKGDAKKDSKKKVAKPAAPNPATVEVWNRQSSKIDTLVDGDAVKLRVTLDKPSELAYVASFVFADDER